MSLKLLAEYNLFQSQRDQYSIEEREKILADFKKKLSTEMSKSGDGIIDFLDGINNL